MRATDGPTDGLEYVTRRAAKAAYGLVFALIGLVVMFWLPATQEWVRLGAGFVLILLGGVLIDSSAVVTWAKVVADLRPFARTPK